MGDIPKGSKIPKLIPKYWVLDATQRNADALPDCKDVSADKTSVVSAAKTSAPVWRTPGGCLRRCLLTQQMSCLLTQQMSWLQTHLCNLQQWPHGQVEVFARILIFGARGLFFGGFW